MSFRDRFDDLTTWMKGTIHASTDDGEQEMANQRFIRALNEVLDPSCTSMLTSLAEKRTRLCQLLLGAEEDDLAALANRLALADLGVEPPPGAGQANEGKAAKGPAIGAPTDRTTAMEKLLMPNILCTGTMKRVADSIMVLNFGKEGSGS